MVNASIDLTGLNETLKTLELALIGTGGDASNVVRDESRRLAEEISKRARAKDKKKLADKIDKNVRGTFDALGAGVDFAGHSGKEGRAGIKWYRWDQNYLYGVARDSDMRKASVNILAGIYYHAKTLAGKKRIVLPFKHPRGQQVAISTKVLISKSGLNAVARYVRDSIGKLPASWLATAKKIDPSAHGPAWIERHIKSGVSSKSITDLTRLSNPETPMVTFGSKAEGVMKFNRVIQNAVDIREKKMHARIGLILSGYSKDVANGIRVKRHANQNKSIP